jgi:hypothetical protein
VFRVGCAHYVLKCGSPDSNSFIPPSRHPGQAFPAEPIPLAAHSSFGSRGTSEKHSSTTTSLLLARSFRSGANDRWLTSFSHIQRASSVPSKHIRKMPKSSNLSLNLPAMSKERTKSSGALRSPPLSPPYGSPHSPHSPGREVRPSGNGGAATFDVPQSPITALPQPHPPSPRTHEKPKSIFSTAKFSRSQSRLVQESSNQQHSDALPAMASMYQQGKSPGSTPDLLAHGGDGSSASDRE